MGSSPKTSSPTSASAIARRISGVGLVTVSDRRSMMVGHGAAEIGERGLSAACSPAPCYSPSPRDPWCSGPTCQPVTLEIAGSNPVGSASPLPILVSLLPSTNGGEAPTQMSDAPIDTRRTELASRLLVALLAGLFLLGLFGFVVAVLDATRMMACPRRRPCRRPRFAAEAHLPAAAVRAQAPASSWPWRARGRPCGPAPRPRAAPTRPLVPATSEPEPTLARRLPTHRIAEPVDPGAASALLSPDSDGTRRHRRGRGRAGHARRPGGPLLVGQEGADVA